MSRKQPSDPDRTFWLERMVDEADAEPAQSVPVRDVFRRLRAYHAEQAEADVGRGTSPIRGTD